MSERIEKVLEGVVEEFRTGKIPEAIALSVFPIPNIPAAKWSLLNRMLMVLAGTYDARGIRQWNAIGRSVKKGGRAFWILAPRFKKTVKKVEEAEETEKDNEANNRRKEERVLSGFLAVPVFRVEDTEGESVEYEKVELPELPLLEVANEWGINTKAVGGQVGVYGRYIPGRKEIQLASPEECVFFHELAHAGHERVLGALKGGQDWKQEVVAELSATVLSHLVGKKPVNLGHHYRYIEEYAKKANRTPYKACLEVIGDVESVLNLILQGRQQN